MGKQRGAAGASLLALLALAAAPAVVYAFTRDPVMTAVGGLVIGSATAYLILVVAMATRDCAGYREGVARVFDGADGGSGGYAGWGLAVMGALSGIGLVVRIWRSEDPLWRGLGVVGLLVGAVAGAAVLVVVVMAFGDLVDRLLHKRRG